MTRAMSHPAHIEKSKSAGDRMVLPGTLRMVAWEVTRSCNLACVHCRASSACGPYEGELDTGRCLQLLDEIAAFSQPVIILTGGEPLLRPDIFEIAAYGDSKGLRMVMATNGTLVDDETAIKIREAGIRRVSISLDGIDAQRHDAFRQVPGAFEGALSGIEALKRAGVEFQVNTTITRMNLDQIEGLLALAQNLGAAAHHIFLLVPTGRGKEMAHQAISPNDYEKTLDWFYETGLACPMQLKATCAPHFYRIYHQRKKERAQKALPENPLHAMTRGCLGRELLRVHLPPRAGPALRVSRARLRAAQGEALRGDLETLGHFPGSEGSEEIRRQVRPLRVHHRLRRLPGPGLRKDGRLSGRRAAVYLRTQEEGTRDQRISDRSRAMKFAVLLPVPDTLMPYTIVLWTQSIKKF